jgi:DNA primase
VAGRINDEDIQALRERADIAVVVGDYTSLKRAGSTLKGLCPFHAEKTASFTVDSARGFFHCFGCGEGGDVYGFLQKVEALTFPEAVERLARIVGFQLRYAELSVGQAKALGRRTRLTQALADAAAFYREQIATDEGAPARDYLRSRGLGRADADHFQLGWAPDQWDELVGCLRTKGYSDEEVADAGLATRGQRGLIDRFRGRVVFPILDAGGKDVVAFGGRVLPGVRLRTGPREGAPPKYINSSESIVYKKSQTLYALNWARSEVTRRQLVLVVEGYMDVIGLHRAGIRHAVATCGTALTADHFRALEKFTPRVVLALDADDAGFAAAERARALAAEVQLREVGVLPLPPGKDPADLAEEGEAAVEAALANVKTAVEFQIEHLLRGADVSTPEGQVDAYRRTFPLLARLDDRFLRYSYIRDLVAPAVRLSADRIERELDAEVATQREAPIAAAASPSGSVTPTHLASGAGRRLPGDLVGATPADPQLLLEREVLQAALQVPDLLPAAWKLVTADDFRAPLSRTLFEALNEAPPGNLGAVLALLPDDDTRSRVRALALTEARHGADAKKVAEWVAGLRAAAVQREIDAVWEQVARVGEQLDPAERRRLTSRRYELERRRRDLVEGRDA